jgi:S1-C subfamily serine protease
MKQLILALIMSMCVSCSSSCILSRSVKDLYHESNKSVYLIEQIDGYCSSFHVGNGLVLTAGHCIDGPEFIVHADKNTHIQNPIVVVDDDETDIAILYIPEVKNRSFLFLSSSNVEIGERLTVIGFPSYLGHKTIDIGYVIGTGFINKTPIIFGSGNSFPGESGGPVLNELGQVVGIVSKVRPSGHTYASGSHIHRDISAFVASDVVRQRISQILFK